MITKPLSTAMLALLLTAAISLAYAAPAAPVAPIPNETAAQVLGPVECLAVPFDGHAAVLESGHVAFIDASARWAIIVSDDPSNHDAWVVRWDDPDKPWTSIQYFNDAGYPNEVCAYIGKALQGAGYIPKPSASYC